jgi:acetoin utilization deacetylase AcuC-like enzyme
MSPFWRAISNSAGLDNILIIDWDVHHGNGTQHIFEDDPSVFYFSTHQYPFYPGTAPVRKRARRGKGYTMNPLPPAPTTRRTLTSLSINSCHVLAYRPDCVLISAGFDAHYADPLAHMQVNK